MLEPLPQATFNSLVQCLPLPGEVEILARPFPLKPPAFNPCNHHAPMSPLCYHHFTNMLPSFHQYATHATVMLFMPPSCYQIINTVSIMRPMPTPKCSSYHHATKNHYATIMPPSCHHHATIMPPSCHHHVPSLPPWP